MTKRNPTCGCGREGVCNETELDCHPCCRCVPLRLCAVFEEYGCECDGISTLMQIDENDEYAGNLACAGETMDIRVLLNRENDTCYWRVISEAFYIDELFEIGAEGQSCEEPQLEIDAPFYECPGTVTITKHREEVLDLVEDEDGCLSPYCGGCRCVCATLCVTRNENGEVVQEELPWGGEGWGDIGLERDDYTGECLIVIDGYDPVEISDCGTSISFFVEDGYGNSVYGYCKACSCQKIGVPCCDVPLPEVLYATFVSIDCPCLEDFTVALSWRRLMCFNCQHNLPLPTDCGMFVKHPPEDDVWAWIGGPFTLELGWDCEPVHNYYISVAPCSSGVCPDEQVSFVVCFPCGPDAPNDPTIITERFCVPKECSPIYFEAQCDCPIYTAELFGFRFIITE